MMNGQDFHDEWLKFSQWMVEIFMMAGRDFDNDKSRIIYFFS